MKGNQLIALGAMAVVALLTALLLSGRSSSTTGDERIGSALFDGLEAALNDIDKVRLSDEEQTLTLVRGDGGWSVRERDDYPAEVTRVRQLLLAVAGARVLERKTSNPENYAALGLQAPTTITLAGGELEEQRLSVGNSARRGSATYVRRGDEAATWLVSGSISAPVDPTSWIDPIIVNIPGKRIQSVTVVHEDGEKLTIEKAGREDTGYVVQDIPTGKELRYESIANPLGSSLANLRLEEVRAADAEESPLAGDQTATTRVRYSAFDGLVIEARTFAQGDQRWVTLEASIDEAQATRFAPQGDGGETDGKLGEGAGEAADEERAPTLAEVRAEAEALNRQLAPWVYAVGQYKFEQLTRRMDELVQDPPPTPDAG